jgi:hypothetical protein
MFTSVFGSIRDLLTPRSMESKFRLQQMKDRSASSTWNNLQSLRVQARTGRPETVRALSHWFISQLDPADLETRLATKALSYSVAAVSTSDRLGELLSTGSNHFSSH